MRVMLLEEVRRGTVCIMVSHSKEQIHNGEGYMQG